MARVTIEYCIDAVPNRFELVILAAKRARELSQGSPARVKLGNDKNAIVALREIAEHAGLIEETREQAIVENQKEIPEDDKPAEDEMNFPIQMVRQFANVKGKSRGGELLSNVKQPTFAKNYKKSIKHKKSNDGFRNQIVTRHWNQTDDDDNEADIRGMMASHMHREQ